MMVEDAVDRLTVTERRKRSLLVDVSLRLLKEKPLGIAGGIVVVLMLLTGIFANLLAPYGETEIHLADRLAAPSGQHLLGTDDLGRDLLSRIIFGARISMIVGLTAAVIDTLVATAIGILSGFVGGKMDIVIQRFVDAWMCFPGLVLILSIMSLLGPGLFQVTLVIGLSAGIRNSRVVRSATLGIKENVYVQSATTIGCSTRRILTHHILPNVMAPILIIFTIEVGSAILAEASLSFLGFGIPPPNPSWGGMLSGAGRQYMLQAPWMAIWPGLALSIVVYGVNMLGDAMRDLLDPRLRGGLGRYGGVHRKIRKRLVRQQKAGLSEEHQ